jgi:Multicopper oxidase
MASPAMSISSTINDQQPGPLIEVDEGDDIEVFVRNDLPVKTTIHWHGKHLQPWWQILLCCNLFQILRRISYELQRLTLLLQASCSAGLLGWMAFLECHRFGVEPNPSLSGC